MILEQTVNSTQRIRREIFNIQTSSGTRATEGVIRGGVWRSVGSKSFRGQARRLGSDAATLQARLLVTSIFPP
jgi:hypothetical protein